MVIYENVREEILNVGTTSIQISATQILPTKRKLFYFRNSSLNDADIITISLSGNTPAVANRGIILRKGDIYTESSQAGFEVWSGQINAICATANGILSVVER